MKKLRITIDNSALKTYRLCPKRFELSYINQYVDGSSVPASFGQVFHTAAAVFDLSSRQHENGVKCTQELEALLDVNMQPSQDSHCGTCQALNAIKTEHTSTKSLNNLTTPRYGLEHALRLFYAFVKWQNFDPNSRFKNFDPPIIEQHLSEMLYDNATLEIVYNGFIDKVGTDQVLNLPTIADYKTTSWRNHFSDKTRISAQLTGYIWLLNQKGYDIKDGAFVTANTYLYKTKPIDESFFEVHSSRRRPDQIERWKENVIAWGKKIAANYRDKNFPTSEEDSCFAFNTPCTFLEYCLASKADQTFMAQHFEKSEWGGFKIEEL